jgi:biotin carboxylase
MSKTLMIIGAGHEQVPAIQMAVAMGFRVVTTDRNELAPGVVHAHCFERVSTGDKEGNLAAARKHGIAGVMTLGSETAVPVVAYVAGGLGLPGFSEETAYKATNKNAMRAAFQAFGVPAPACQPAETLAEVEAFAMKHGFPLVLKPSDCSGQRGTTKVETAEELAAALESALQFSTDGRAIIEEFCEGPEINVTAAVQGGEVHFLSLSDRVTAAPPHFGIAIEHISPPQVDEEMAEAIRESSRLAIEAIGLRDGIAYPQVIASPRGPRVIEIAVRIPGGHMREVAWYRSGVDMIEIAIRQAVGDEDPWGRCKRMPPVPALSVKFITELDCAHHAGRRVKTIEGMDAARELPGVLWVRFYLEAGGTIPKLDSSAARFGAVIASGKDREEACRLAREAANKIVYPFVEDGAG